MDNKNRVAVVKDKVQRYLVDLVGNIQIDRDGDFNLRHGSTQVFVRVEPLGEDATYVSVWAVTNGDLTPSPELYEYLVKENRYRFGNLIYDEHEGKASIRFQYNLLGEFLDPDELKSALGMIAVTADRLDDEIRSRFGGRVFHME